MNTGIEIILLCDT